MDRFADREMTPQVESLRKKIKAQADPKYGNALGVVYARYGRYDLARAEFQKVLGRKEYGPAPANLGNLARTCYELKDYKGAATCYAEIRKQEPALAGRFAYLDAASAPRTRNG